MKSCTKSNPNKKKPLNLLMFNFNLILIFSLLQLFISCNDQKSNWYKGNLHTHTFWSDGDEFPENVVKWYKENGYDFLALTDHNVILEGELWRDFPEDHAVLKQYLQEYGEEWVEMQPHEEKEGVLKVRLKTLEEFRSMHEEADKFLLIMGNEISNPHAVHLLSFHQDRIIPAVKGSKEERQKMIQETVDNLKAYRQETGRNVYPALAHPNFTWAITAEMMTGVPGLRFFEVYNGHPKVYNDGDDNRAGTDRMWDIVLAHRLTKGEGEILYGLATDDAHSYHGGNVGPGKGWVMVRSDGLTPEAILDAIDKGDFYASTGVVLKDGVEFKTEFIGTLKGTDITGTPTADSTGNEIENTTQTYSSDIGKILATSTSLSPSYTFTGDELYVRARITSSADQYDPISGKLLGKQKGWVQPQVHGSSR